MDLFVANPITSVLTILAMIVGLVVVCISVSCCSGNAAEIGADAGGAAQGGAAAATGGAADGGDDAAVPAADGGAATAAAAVPVKK